MRLSQITVTVEAALLMAQGGMSGQGHVKASGWVLVKVPTTRTRMSQIHTPNQKLQTHSPEVDKTSRQEKVCEVSANWDADMIDAR